jgi:hypothetical protein
MTMKRLFTIAAVAALVVGCGGAAAPTPQIVYVTPAPAGAAPGTVKPIATPTEAPDVTPEPLPEETVVIIDETPEPERAGAYRENPIPVGTAAKIGDWTIKITAVNRNAWKVVKAANSFNEPPPAGTRMVMVSVYAKYSGEDRVALDATTHQFVLGDDTQVERYSFDDPTCGVLPGNDLLMDDPTVRNGGVVKGNNCFIVEEADVPSLALYWSSEMFDVSEDGVWFALK